jgi:Tfp pilus assembly protein PilN
MLSRPLDFNRQSRGSRSRVWLLLGGVLIVASAIHYQSLSADLKDAQEKLDRRGHEASLEKKKTAPVKQNPTVQAAMQGLHMNWNPLFDAIEAGTRKDVALLALEPDAAKAQVRLNLEAKNRKAMQEYVQGLALQKGLSQVSLIAEETQLENPLQPIRFSVTATWQQ